MDILFVTGTRADYGKLEPLAVAAAKSGCRVTFFVTGMHMMRRYGLTKIEVHRQPSFNVVEFVNQRDGDPQDIILSKTVVGFSDYIREHNPDLVVVHGDRIESLACSIVCATNYIPCAHVEGGEVSGTIDEQLRHCNTKLSSYHLVSSIDAAARVARLGEPEDRIFVIGSPELDVHARPSGVTLDEVKQRYEINFSEYGICIFHPVTSEQESMSAQASSLFSSLIDSGKNYVVILPNNDPGSDDIVSEINRLPADRFRVLPSMRFSYFSELMRNAKAVIGNSSMGVREAPFLGVPSLDIGTRQSKRGCADSVWQCAAIDHRCIEEFLKDVWGKTFPRSSMFGEGNASDSFIEFIRDVSMRNFSKQKYFSE